MFEFFDTLKQNIIIVKNVAIFFVTFQSKAIYKKIVETDYDALQYDALFFYNRVCEKINQRCGALYKNNSTVAILVDSIYYCAQYAFAIVQLRRVEPLSKTWSCVSALTKSYYNYKEFNYRYNEVYEQEKKTTLENVSAIVTNLYADIVSIMKRESSLAECLLTYKFDNKYIHRNSNANRISLDNKISKITLEESEVKFLSIEYHSMDYLNPIVLELDKNDYLVNNEILSAVFVKRLLEYQVPYSKFNKNYTILIMDNNLKTISLNFDEYIILHKTYYTVVKPSYGRENLYSNDEPSKATTEPSKATTESSKATIFRESFGSVEDVTNE